MLKKILAIIAMLYATIAFAAPVDVNKATAAELDSIKGIGPAISSRIVEERKKGDFKDWNDFIDRVKGVGEHNAAKFSTDGLTVNGGGFKGAAAPAAKADAKAAATPAAAAPATPAAPAAKEEKKDPKAEAKMKAEEAKKAKAEEKAKKAEEAKAKKEAAKQAKEDAKKAKADKKAAQADAPKDAASAPKK
jgi:competence protein ComEA